MRNSKATIHDVARVARVSTTTVSRYLNKSIRLPGETTARIDRAIADLHYRLNVLAKRLLKGATEIIGLATPDIGNPFFAELASSVEARAATLGYLASGLAHHINNPLATVRTFLQLLPTHFEDREFTTKYWSLT